MRKFKFFIIGILCMLFLIACEQFLRDIEEDLSYWATIVYIKNADISRLPLDNDKYASIPCVNDYKINLEIFNEKKHKIKEAIDSTSDKDIVVFEKGVVGSDGTNPPKAGVDYTLKQKNQNTLELNLSKAFLERSEWSSQNLSPTITLWNKEGRKFPQTFTFKLRANTPPPALEYKAIGKTKDADASGKRYYVLCFEVKDMDKKINTGELLHKDIAGLSVTAEGGTENSIPLTVNEDGNSFNISNSNGLLLPVASVNKLEAADITTGTPDDIPTGKGIIYFKTDVEVKGAAKTYTFKLFDKKGLKSSEIAVSTSKTQAEDAKLFYNSTDISTDAGNSGSPYPINTELSVTVKAKTETSGATIRGTLFKKESGTWSEVNGIDSGTSNEVDITLKPLSIISSTIEYKISLTTGGTGFAEGTAKEFYVNVTRSSILTINGDDGDAWSKLKTEVEKPSGGAKIIKINGTIKAKNGDTKIEVKRIVKIMGKNGKTSDILNADNRIVIFDIFSSGNLTLEKLTLQKGKNTDSSSGGGAIYCAVGKLTTDDIIIENCTATQKNGGGIYAKDTNNIILKNTEIKGCTANENGGAIFAQGATVEMTNCTLRNNEAGDGGGVYTDGGTVTMTDCTLARNKATGSYSSSGGGVYFEGAGTGTLNMTNCTLRGNTAKSGGGVYAESDGSTGSTVIISGGIIGGTGTNDANKATGSGSDEGNGGGIYIGETCTLTLKDSAQVIGNTAIYNGAGIYTKGTLTMENCTITDNKTTGASINTGGGGVYVESGIVEIKDATKIYHNYTDASGGGIYVKGGSLTLTNTTIGGEQFYDGTYPDKTKGNTAKSGGGVYIEGNGTSVTMNGGSIQYNKTIDGNGGGVCIKGERISFTMNGGKITQCKADVTLPSSVAGCGGGICVDYAPSSINITIKGSAEISNNESTCQGTASGGGIYGGFNSIITVSENATIKNNKAKGFGGGVYIKDTFKFTGGTITGNTITGPNKLGTGIFSEDSSATLEMSGNARVANDNDIYLNKDSVITITNSPLTGTAPVARITVADDKYLTGTQVLLTTAGSGVTLESETYKFAVTPQIVSGTPQPWTVGGNGYLKEGRYTEVPYGQLEAYLDNNASATEVNYIEVTGISAAAFEGTYGSPPNPGPLGKLLKKDPSKKVALKLPSDLSGVTNMDSCFVHCKNLVSLENLPSGVTNMRACFYDCKGLTTGPDIPATVTNMKECFRFCDKLQSVKINRSYFGCDFYMTFNGCDLPDGGIQVPSGDLTNYKNNADTMGTTPGKFAGF